MPGLAINGKKNRLGLADAFGGKIGWDGINPAYLLNRIEGSRWQSKM